MALAMMLAMSTHAIAQDSEKPNVEPDMLYAPLVYDHYATEPHQSMKPAKAGDELYALDASDGWLQEAMSKSNRTQVIRHRAMIDNPQLVAYNASRLPEAPPRVSFPVIPVRACSP